MTITRRDAMRTRWVLGLLIFVSTAGCAGWNPPPPELSSPRSLLVYVYQRPTEVAEADWSVCDLEADRRARYDYRAEQEMTAALLQGFFGAVPLPVPVAVGVFGAALGAVALSDAALAQVPEAKRQAVLEELAEMNNFYAKRAHRCLTTRGYRLPVPPTAPGTRVRCTFTTREAC